MKAREEQHLKQLREQQGENGVEEGKEDEGQTATQSYFYRHCSLFALITVVVLITVATLYSRNNLLSHKPQSNVKKSKVNGANQDNDVDENDDDTSNPSNDSGDEGTTTNNANSKKTNNLRRSSDKVKNNHNTQRAKQS
jgi:hypothetical protein